MAGQVSSGRTKRLGIARCPECIEVLNYAAEFDAYFCATCDEWDETACDASTCEFCKKRPARPSGVEAVT